MPSAAEARHRRVGKPARDDPGEVLEVGIDVEAYAMEADPTPEPDADARDLRVADEHADLTGAAGALDAETRESGDQPILQPMDEGS